MTTRYKIVRLLIITLALIGLGFGARELYYFRTIRQDNLMVEVELPELIQRAPLIIRGAVEESIGTSRYADPAGELVVGTRWKIAVNETLKGQATESVIVRTLGGRYGLTVMWMEDEVEFTNGETAILFLEPDPSGQDYRVVDMYQGHYVIKNGQAYQQESNEAKSVSELEAVIRKSVMPVS